MTEESSGAPWILQALAAGFVHLGVTVVYVGGLMLTIRILDDQFYMQDPMMVGDLMFYAFMATLGTLFIQFAWGLPMIGLAALAARHGRIRTVAVITGVFSAAGLVAAVNIAYVVYATMTFRP